MDEKIKIFNLDDVIFKQAKPTLGSRIRLHGIFSLSVTAGVFSSAEIKNSLEKFALVIILVLFGNAEMFFIEWIKNRPRFQKRRDSRVENLRIILHQLMNDKNFSPKRVTVFENKLSSNSLLDVRMRVAKDINGKKYHIYYNGPLEGPFEADLYQIHSKLFSLQQKYLIVPVV